MLSIELTEIKFQDNRQKYLFTVYSKRLLFLLNVRTGTNFSTQMTRSQRVCIFEYDAAWEWCRHTQHIHTKANGHMKHKRVCRFQTTKNWIRFYFRVCLSNDHNASLISFTQPFARRDTRLFRLIHVWMFRRAHSLSTSCQSIRSFFEEEYKHNATELSLLL